jgi:hypothetical protein
MENYELKKHLNNDNIISKVIWKTFYDASVSGTAVPMQWLLSNLAILYKRVIAGDIIAVEGKEFVLKRETFKDIVEREFYDVLFSDIKKIGQSGQRDGIDHPE